MSFRFARPISRSSINARCKEMLLTSRFPAVPYRAAVIYFYGTRDTQGKQPKSALICSALSEVGTG